MIHIVLFQPEIPQNTGNIGRLCAFTECRLHLIYPLGFELSDKQLRRSGMDYWHSLDIRHYATWEAFEKCSQRPQRLWLLTTKSQKSHWAADFQDGDGLIFGRETAGCPQWLHEWVGEDRRITIPHGNSQMRSLNLSTSVGIATYEALRQTNLLEA